VVSLIVAAFRAGKRGIRSAYSANANKTFNPAIGGAPCGCNFIGVPERASRAWPALP
jgi:hypothetical protein